MVALHKFHIPVMGTGYTADTPARVAPFGINSVVSLVDDVLLDQIRLCYAKELGIETQAIPLNTEDGRAKRITSYMDLLQDVVNQRFNELRNDSWTSDRKQQYFRMLPSDSTLRLDWEKAEAMPDNEERESLRKSLEERMTVGHIDANIMVKLDRMNYQGSEMLPEEFSDAKAALRGYALSKVDGSMVFSAGINQPLYTYMANFDAFRRDANGHIKKRIVIKVSDFRSAMIQGNFLARKGLEVSEYRIESGLNCGGHAFASQGELLPTLLEEFSSRREELAAKHRPLVARWYKKAGLEVPKIVESHIPNVTVQGGIGNHGEMLRLLDHGFEGTGWGSPFLLVPEASPVDSTTLEQLRVAQEEDLFLSDVSPIGVPFNNLRNSGSENSKQKNIAAGCPGSKCPKGFLVTSAEFSEIPVCTASRFYQTKKLEQIENSTEITDKEQAREEVLVKSCICDHLGNSTLMALGAASQDSLPQSICPGPNLAWFNKIVNLEQMVDHIYGRGKSLVSSKRPHMFAQEIRMYVDYLRKLIKKGQHETEYLETFARNLAKGIDYCKDIAGQAKSFVGENLDSLKDWSDREGKRLRSIVHEHLDRLVQEPEFA